MTTQIEESTGSHEESPPAATSRPGGLRKAVLLGVSWEILGQFVQTVLRFANNLILTKLLAPEAFGVMGITQAIIMSLSFLADIGLRPVVIQHPRGEEPDFLDAVWTISIVRGAGMWVLCCLVAWPASIFYAHMPELLGIIPITGASMFIRGMSSTSLWTASRRLQSWAGTLTETISQLVGTILTLVLAYYWSSVYALAFGSVLTAVAYTVVSFCLVDRRRHRLRWDREVARIVSSLGRWVWLSGWVSIVCSRGDRLTLGWLMSSAMTGQYVIGSNLAMIPFLVLQRLNSYIAQPLYAQLAQADPHIFRDRVRKFRIGIIVTHLPVFAAMVVLGTPVVDFLYEGEYHAAGDYCELTALAMISSAIVDIGPVFLAQGKGALHFLTTAARMVGLLIGMGGGYLLGQWWGGRGIEGLLYGIIAAPWISYPYLAFHYRRIHAWLPDLDALAAVVQIALITGRFAGWY